MNLDPITAPPPTDVAAIGLGAIEPATPGVVASSQRRRPVRVTLALAWLVVLIGASILAEWLPLADPADSTGTIHMTPFTSWSEPLGTDRLARSQLSRVIYGARISLSAGVAAATVAFVLGVAIGLVAGYTRRAFDATVGLATDALLAFPGLVVLLALSAVLGPSLRVVIIGLSVISLPTFIRLARANTLRVASAEYVESARATGSSTPRILVREVLPNIVGPVASYAVVVVAILILAESSLSYLGLGVAPPTATWGVMISEAQSELARRPWAVAVPGGVLFTTVYSFNVIAEWLRRRSDLAARI